MPKGEGGEWPLASTRGEEEVGQAKGKGWIEPEAIFPFMKSFFHFLENKLSTNA